MREPSRSSLDEVIERYAKDLDLSLIRERLERTHEQRLQDLVELQRAAEELRRAGEEAWRRERERSTHGGGLPGPPRATDPE